MHTNKRTHGHNTRKHVVVVVGSFDVADRNTHHHITTYTHHITSEMHMHIMCTHTHEHVHVTRSRCARSHNRRLCADAYINMYVCLRYCARVWYLLRSCYITWSESVCVCVFINVCVVYAFPNDVTCANDCRSTSNATQRLSVIFIIINAIYSMWWASRVLMHMHVHIFVRVRMDWSGVLLMFVSMYVCVSELDLVRLNTDTYEWQTNQYARERSRNMHTRKRKCLMFIQWVFTVDYFRSIIFSSGMFELALITPNTALWFPA